MKKSINSIKNPINKVLKHISKVFNLLAIVDLGLQILINSSKKILLISGNRIPVYFCRP